MSEDKIEKLVSDVGEIKTALLGNFTNKGLVSRVRSLEKLVNIVGGVTMITITAVIGQFINNLFT